MNHQVGPLRQLTFSAAGVRVAVYGVPAV